MLLEYVAYYTVSPAVDSHAIPRVPASPGAKGRQHTAKRCRFVDDSHITAQSQAISRVLLLCNIWLTIPYSHDVAVRCDNFV